MKGIYSHAEQQAINLAIGSALKELRRASRMSLSDAAEAAGFRHRQTVSAYESGKRMSRRALKAFARAYGTEPEIILATAESILKTNKFRLKGHLRNKLLHKGRLGRKPKLPIVVLRERSLAVTHPFILKVWDKDANGDLDPYTISTGYKMPIHFLCAINSAHKFTMTIKRYLATRGNKCPICRGKWTSAGQCLGLLVMMILH